MSLNQCKVLIIIFNILPKLPQMTSYTLLTSSPHPRSEWCQRLDQGQNTH